MGHSTLFIRTDAGPALGTGHFMRMLALGEAWIERGGALAFGGELPAPLVRRASDLGATVQLRPESVDDASWTIECARESGSRTVVADGYCFPLSFQRAVRAAGLRLMVVDDNGENESYDADWILNVNASASLSIYARRNDDSQCLLGTNYALLRAAFRREHQSARQPSGRSLLVTMGGADPPNATGLILKALQGHPSLETTVLVGAANPRLAEYHAQLPRNATVLSDVQDVASVMKRADLALAAVGGTIWELGLMGVPCVGLALAENQVMLAQELHRRGAIEYAGDARGATSATRWLEQVVQLLKDPARSGSLVNTARALVDGHGAVRVVERLEEK